MGQMVKDRLGSRDNVHVVFAVQQNDHQLAYMAAQLKREVVVYGIDWDFALDNMNVSNFPNKDGMVDVIFAKDLFKPGGMFGELTPNDVYNLSLNCHDRDFVVRRILGLTFDNLVKAAQQAKLALSLDASTDLSFDQIVSLVVEQARIVHGKARAKRLAAGWGRFTWPGCPPGGVEATAEAVLENLKDNYLNDAVAPVAKLAPDGQPQLVPRQQLPDGVSWDNVLQRHFADRTVPDIQYLCDILREVIEGDRRPITPHLKMTELTPRELREAPGASAAPRPPVTLDQLCPDLLSQFEGLNDMDVIAAVDAATATTSGRVFILREAPARLLGAMGTALQAKTDIYLPSEGYFRATFALHDLDEPQEAVKAAVTPVDMGHSGGHSTRFQLAKDVQRDTYILLGRHKRLGCWTFALRPSPDDDSVCKQLAAATQKWLDRPSSWQPAPGMPNTISRPLSFAIDQQQVQGPSPVLTLPGEFLKGLPDHCPATFCGSGFGELNVCPPTSLRGPGTLHRLEELMQTAAAHGAQRLMVQQQAGGLSFSVDHMDEAAQDEIRAIADPKQAIMVKDTCVAFDQGATEGHFSHSTRLPDPAALVLKIWQEADQRVPQQLSVCSSGTQIGKVVVRCDCVNGCVITPFEMMVEEMTSGLGAEADIFTLHAADGKLHWTFLNVSPATAAEQARRLADSRKLSDAGEYIWQHGQAVVLGKAAAAAESMQPVWTRGPGDTTRSALPPAGKRLHIPGEEVAALLGQASPPRFTQLSVTMCGQTAAVNSARMLGGSLYFEGIAERLLHIVQKITDQHQLDVKTALCTNSSADGLLLSFVGLSAELEQQAVDELHSGSGEGGSRWFAWDGGYRTQLRDFKDGLSLRLGGPAKECFEAVPCQSTICIDEALSLPVSVQHEGSAVAVRAPEMARLLKALLVIGQQRGSRFLTLQRYPRGGIVGLDRVQVTGAEVLEAMAHVEQRGAWTRLGHGVISILLTELEEFSDTISVSPEIPVRTLREVGAVTGRTLLATHKRLSFDGQPLCDDPGETLTQLQNRVPHLQGGSGLKFWLPKVIRSEAAEVPVEQELHVAVRLVAGAGPDKVLWLDVTMPDLDVSTPNVVAAYKRARGPDSTWLRVASSGGLKMLERPVANIRRRDIASSKIDDHLAEDLCLEAIRKAAPLRPQGKPAAELRLSDGRWVANLMCSWNSADSRLHLRVSKLDDFQPIVAALRSARPAAAPADFCISLAADPQQVQEAAAATKDLKCAPPVIFLGFGKEDLNGDEFLAKLKAMNLYLGVEFLPQTDEPDEPVAQGFGDTWDQIEAALPGAITVSCRADGHMGHFRIPGDAAIASPLTTIKEAHSQSDGNKPTAELRLHGGAYACRLALQQPAHGPAEGGHWLKPSGISANDVISALQAGRPAGAPADFAITLSTVEVDISAAIAAGAQDRWAPPPPIYIGVRGEQVDTAKVVACLAESERVLQWQRPDDTAGTSRRKKRKAAPQAPPQRRTRSAMRSAAS